MLFELNKGQKVLVRTNEDEPIKVGEFLRFEPVSQAKNLLPVILLEDGNEVIMMGMVIPYSDEMFSMLSELTPRRQYELLVDIRNMFSILNRKHKNKPNVIVDDACDKKPVWYLKMLGF